ncbi:unnamed protein product, partial [Sphacelaria rigidula]
ACRLAEDDAYVKQRLEEDLKAFQMELAEGNARVAELTRLADTATAEREKAESEHVAVVAASVAEPKAAGVVESAEPVPAGPSSADGTLGKAATAKNVSKVKGQNRGSIVARSGASRSKRRSMVAAARTV